MHKDTDKSPSDFYFNDDVFEPGANIHVNNITVSKVLLHASISRLNDQVNKQVTDGNAPPTDPAVETLTPTACLIWSLVVRHSKVLEHFVQYI